MIIDGVVVLYEPREEELGNIFEYASLLNKLFVIDNSCSSNVGLIARLKSVANISVVEMGQNAGIAKALRIGLDMAMSDGADFCLTMDQDSVFPVESMRDIKNILRSEDIDDYGIIGLNVNNEISGDGLSETKTLITSGNFINIKNYRLINGFREELFIDSVDFDLDHQFYEIGKKIAVICNISIKHKIGDPQKRRLPGFKTISISNHAPVRCYYRYRNNYVLYHEDKHFYKDIYDYDKKQLIKILLFEKHRLAKLKMIMLAKKHAKKKKLGKLQINDEGR